MRGAEQPLAVSVEEPAFDPVQFHGHVRAAVEVADDAPAMADEERRGRFAAGDDPESHARPAVDEP